MAEHRLAVIGHPVAHSRSPAMYTAAFEALGMADDWSYEAIDVERREFPTRIHRLFADGWTGVNVTVPFKSPALALADSASDAAREIGAANTLTFKDKRINAQNTDAPALIAALPKPPAAKRALVLGSGGAARAAVWALIEEAAQVDIWNRTGQRAKSLAQQFAVNAVDEPRAGLYHLIVNCTTVGMEGGGGELEDLPLGEGSLHAGQTVVDMVYGSEETPLSKAARQAGATVVDGLEILVRQGAASFLIWTGKEPPVSVMREAARAD